MQENKHRGGCLLIIFKELDCKERENIIVAKLRIINLVRKEIIIYLAMNYKNKFGIKRKNNKMKAFKNVAMMLQREKLLKLLFKTKHQNNQER